MSATDEQTLLLVVISDEPTTGSFTITSWDAFAAAGFGHGQPNLGAAAIFDHLVLGVTDLYAVGDAIRAVSGTVSITRDVGGKRMTGRYDLRFPDGARAVGDFDAPYCNETNMCAEWNR